MDRQEAIKKLYAVELGMKLLESEAKKLRKIIEQGDKLIYDKSKIYIGVKYGCPYIMTGGGEGDGEDFCFHSFDGTRRSMTRWGCPQSTGQKCLDYHIADGFEIHVFDDIRKAFQFFLDELK
jgi:hypothetical protein